MRGTFLRGAACGFLVLVTFAPAHAADANAVAGMLAAAVAATGDATLTYDSASESGATVTIAGAKVTTTSDGNVASVPNLVLSGVADRQPGGFTATGMAFNAGTATSTGTTATWKTASFEDVIVPSADEIKTHAHVRPFRKLALAGLNLSGADFTAPVDVASISADIGDMADGAPSNVLVRATGVRLPSALLTNSVVNAVVGMMHYDEFLADVTLDSEWDSTADTVTVHALTIDSAKVGKITIAGKASGFSVRGMMDKAKSAEARANARLDALSIRIDNAGFVERLLDMQAGLLGGTRDDVRAQLVGGALPFALSFVSNQAFRDQVQQAMETFLADPRSLTITFAPTAPVPLGKALRTAARSPAALPDLLSPTVQANN